MDRKNKKSIKVTNQLNSQENEQDIDEKVTTIAFSTVELNRILSLISMLFFIVSITRGENWPVNVFDTVFCFLEFITMGCFEFYWHNFINKYKHVQYIDYSYILKWVAACNRFVFTLNLIINNENYFVNYIPMLQNVGIDFRFLGFCFFSFIIILYLYLLYRNVFSKQNVMNFETIKGKLCELLICVFIFATVYIYYGNVGLFICNIFFLYLLVIAIITKFFSKIVGKIEMVDVFYSAFSLILIFVQWVCLLWENMKVYINNVA